MVIEYIQYAALISVHYFTMSNPTAPQASDLGELTEAIKACMLRQCRIA